MKQKSHFWVCVDNLSFLLRAHTKYNVAANGRISKLEALDAGLTFMHRSLLKDDPCNTTFQCTMHEDGWHHKRVEGHPKEREDETKDEAHGGVESFPPHSGWSRWHHPEWGNVEGLYQSCRQMPTLCRYKTTGNTSTGGCDPKSALISVLNQQQWQITRQWRGILLPWLLSFWHPSRWGETRKKRGGHQAISLLGP